MPLISSSRVALLGSDPMALVLGRALALNDNPLIGLFAPDPQDGLKASLFLGVSSLSKAALLAQNPDIVLRTEPVEAEIANQTLAISFLDAPGLNASRHCRALPSWEGAERLESISNQLPSVTFDLQGEADCVERAREFLNGLSERFQAL